MGSVAADELKSQAITPEELATWWKDNIRRCKCPANKILSDLARVVNDRRLLCAVSTDPIHVKERRLAEVKRRCRGLAAERFRKVIRNKQKWWSNFHAARVTYEATVRRGLTVLDREAGQIEPIEVTKLTELLKLIEDTEQFWNGPFVRDRNRQRRADWHLTARDLHNRISKIWESAGLKVSHTPKTNYAKFLAFAVCRAESRSGISDLNIQAVFRPKANI